MSAWEKQRKSTVNSPSEGCLVLVQSGQTIDKAGEPAATYPVRLKTLIPSVITLTGNAALTILPLLPFFSIHADDHLDQ